MAALHSPFRYDFVGSFLRPQAIKNARAAFKAGEITRDELTAVENEQITLLIEKQKRAGYHAITDGEFRRSYWHLDFMWGFHGIDEVELDHGYYFHGEETTHGSIRVSGKISGENHPFVEHFKFVKQFEDETCVARQTMPAPAQLLAELYREDNGKNTDAVYPDHEQLLQDIAAAYRTVIRELYDAGCRNIQFDDCTWGMFCDDRYWGSRQNGGVDRDAVAAEYLRLNNLALENRPEGLTITTHVCRGNYHSTWASKGGYAPVAPFLFAKENVDAFYLEFDDERSGNFEPLRYVADGKKVVLGLITTKSPRLENKDAVIARIHEAAKYIPLDCLCLSPQCGFASCEIGNKLTELEQWNKLKLVKEIAEEVWGK
ncbi:5-methyltetrahydropteroyltriglutamate--homocysteine S-methyltransferase [Gemmiger sp.]